MSFSQGNQFLHPEKKRIRVVLLGLYVHRLVVVFRIDDHRKVELLRVCLRKPGVLVRTPLHWSAYPMSIAQINIVAHPNFVAIIDDGRAGHGKEKAIEKLDLTSVVAKQRRQSVADTQVD